MTPRQLDRLHEPELVETLIEALTAVPNAYPPALAAVAIAVVDGHLSASRGPVRKFTAHHLGVVYLLAELQGATHVRLRRSWDAKSSRAGTAAWPWISDSGIRTRCSELVSWGLVEDTGARGQSPTGRPSAIWTLVGTDPVKLGRDVTPVPDVEPGTLDRLELLLEEAGDDVIIRSQLELVSQVAGIRRASIGGAQ